MSFKWCVSFASAGCLPDHDGWLGVFDSLGEAEAFVDELRDSGDWDESGLYSFSVDAVPESEVVDPF